MKKRIFILLMICLPGLSIFSQNTFQKTFGGAGEDFGTCIRLTIDSGCVILGRTTSFNAGYYDILMVKFDKNYNLQWSRIYGDGPLLGLNNAYEVVQTTDTGFAIAAYRNTSGGDGYILKTDKNGNIQWTKVFEGSNNFTLNSIIKTQDGNIVAFGNGIIPSAGSTNEFALVKIDLSGNLIWTKVYGGPGDEYGYRIKELSNGDLIMCGSTNSFGAGQLDIYLVKTDRDGNFLWGKTYGGSEQEEAYDLKYTSDNGFIMTGITNSWGINGGIYLVKTDTSGTLQWSKVYAGAVEDYGQEVIESNTGGYAVACSTFTYKYAMLLRTDNTGNLTWAKGYGNAVKQNEFKSLQQTADNGFIMAGMTTLTSDTGDIYFVLTDTNGVSGCNEQTLYPSVMTPVTLCGSGGSASTDGTLNTCTTITVLPTINITTLCSSLSMPDYYQQQKIDFCPNPGNTEIVISLNENLSTDADLGIFNCLGKEVMQLIVKKNERAVRLDISGLPAGIYFVKMNEYSGKFVKY